MFDDETIHALETGELILAVDTMRGVNDPYKLPTVLRTAMFARLSDLRGKALAASLREGDRAGAQLLLRTALLRLEKLVRLTFNWVWGIFPDWLPNPNGDTFDRLTDAQRLTLLTQMGFAEGRLGEFDDGRVETIATMLTSGSLTIPTATGVLPEPLALDLAAQLATLNGVQVVATGGSRQVAISERDSARDLMEDAVARVRFIYCGASDLGDRTPELAKIGMQPRRLPGDAQPAPQPGPVGPVTLDTPAKTLSAAALPEHATSMRAYRRPAGGQPELCGTSITPTVSLVQVAPLAAGVTYEVWLVGRNAEGEGPESEHKTIVG